MASAQRQLQALAASLPSDAYARPPLTGDPTTIPQSELIAKGYPLRPDPNLAPDKYQSWLSQASRPVVVVPPHLVARPDRHSSVTDTTRSNWSGDVLSGAAAPYIEVEGVWNVPQMTPGNPWSASNYGVSCSWVGLGGFGTNNLVQGGTESDEYAELDPTGYQNYAYYADYYPWVEWANGEGQVSFSFGINPGDVVYASSWVGDSYGNNVSTGNYSWLYMYNETQFTSTTVSTEAAAGSTFDGSTAEWILENTEKCTWYFGWTCTDTGDLANYGTMYMNTADAMTSDYNYHSWNTDNSYLVNMVDYNVMSSVVIDNPSDSLLFTWDSRY
jgi:hypothetical protein